MFLIYRKWQVISTLLLHYFAPLQKLGYSFKLWHIGDVLLTAHSIPRLCKYYIIDFIHQALLPKLL